MRLRPILTAALGATLLVTVSAYAETPPKHKHHPVGLILHDNVLLQSNASTHSRVLAVLVEQTQVVVLSRHSSWTHVRIWTTVNGWVRTREVVFRKPWITISTYKAPEVHYVVQAHAPQPMRANATVLASATLHRSVGSPAVRTIAARTNVRISAWQQDATGTIWYQINGLWTPGDAIQFQWQVNPAQVSTLAKKVSGKGMWLTLGPVADSAPDAVIKAALHSGVTHLFLESAISPLGFHGKNAVGPLIDAAHRSHIAVIAWVYPYLYDLASDVALTRKVAAFRSSTGGSFDGIAADLERNNILTTVRGYSQLVRSYLGPHYLLIGVTYPPQSSPEYPFAEVGHNYDVVAPMDYWHETKTSRGLNYGQMSYSRGYGYRYAADSVRQIRSAGVLIPIAPIGQVFDDFGHVEMGPYAPSAEEIRGFMQGSKAAGAIGVSFFQWMTATVDEWRVIQSFRY